MLFVPSSTDSDPKPSIDVLSARDSGHAAENARLEALLEGMSEPFCALDAEGSFLAINRAAQLYYERPREDMLGLVIWDIFPGLASTDLPEKCRSVLATGCRLSFEGAFMGRPGRHVTGNIFPYGEGIGISFRDATEHRRSEEALRETQARLKALTDNLTLGMVYQVSDDPKAQSRRFLYLSASCEGLIGIPAEVARRNPSLIYDLVLPEYRALMAEKEREAYEKRALLDVEIAMRHAVTGKTRWHRLLTSPRAMPDGTVVWDGLQVDITDQKEAQAHLRLVINELNHRVKNTLAIVQSLAAQSLRELDESPGLQGARYVLEQRLFALARGHDVLTRENWEGAGMIEIIDQAVSPYRSHNGGHAFTVEGEDLRISPAMALGLSMALHELSTNAVKYGSLSRPEGKVRIAWSSIAGAQERRLVLRWQEQDGPRITAPSRSGFGTRLIEQGLARELNGTVRIDYPPEGVICTVDVPLIVTA